MARTPRDWTERAACLGVPSDAFFVDGSASVNVRRRWCAHCPVAIDCRAFVLANEADGYRYGVSGNMTVAERARYVEKIRAAELADRRVAFGVAAA